MKRVLGVDQSKSQTGVCRIDLMWDDNRPVYDIEKFSVKTLGTPQTIAAWCTMLCDHLNQPCTPALVVYETPVIAQLNNMVLYQISGALIHICTRRDIPILGVHNATLKKWAGISGSEKPIDYIRALTGHEGKLTSDEADAAVLCEIGYYVANVDTDPGTDIKREIVRKLRMSEEEKQEAGNTAKLAKAAATIAADETKQRKAALAAERAQARAQRQAEALRKREEKLTSGPKTRTRSNA